MPLDSHHLFADVPPGEIHELWVLYPSLVRTQNMRPSLRFRPTKQRMRGNSKEAHPVNGYVNTSFHPPFRENSTALKIPVSNSYSSSSSPDLLAAYNVARQIKRTLGTMLSSHLLYEPRAYLESKETLSRVYRIPRARCGSPAGVN